MPRVIMAGIPPTRLTWSHIGYWVMRFLGPAIIFGTVCILYGILAFQVFDLFLYLSKFAKLINGIIILLLGFGSVMTIISLGFTIFSDPGTPSSAIKELRQCPNPSIPFELINSLPRCDKCGQPKPPRCHHCSQCNECHLKMDHHCPSVGVCIALHNQRSFIVMLNWGISTLFISVIYTFIFVLYIWNSIYAVSTKVLLISLIITYFILFIILSTFKHDQMRHVFFNITTLEETFGLYANYSQGIEENMRQVFGSGKMRTYIPGKSPLTGFEWALGQYNRSNTDTNQLDIDVDIDLEI